MRLKLRFDHGSDQTLKPTTISTSLCLALIYDKTSSVTQLK